MEPLRGLNAGKYGVFLNHYETLRVHAKELCNKILLLFETRRNAKKVNNNLVL